jgi:hypothetical protein
MPFKFAEKILNGQVEEDWSLFIHPATVGILNSIEYVKAAALANLPVRLIFLVVLFARPAPSFPAGRCPLKQWGQLVSRRRPSAAPR